MEENRNQENMNQESIQVMTVNTMLELVKTDATTDEDGVFTETIKLVNPVKEVEAVEIHSVDLSESIRKIRAGLVAQSLSTRIVAREIAKLDEKQVQIAGFTDVKQFCKAVFDLKPNTTGQYRRIGAKFFTDDYKVVAGLPDWTVGHFIEVNAMVDDEPSEDGYDYSILKDFIRKSGVTALTSVAKLRKAVQSDRIEEKAEKSEKAKQNLESQEEQETQDGQDGKESRKAPTGNVKATIETMTNNELAGAIIDHVGTIRKLFDKINEGGVVALSPIDELDKVEALALSIIAQ